MKQKNTNEIYNQRVKQFQPSQQYVLNCFKAFFVGGFTCLIGQIIHFVYTDLFSYSKLEADSLTITILILVASLLTGLGIYNKLGKFAGAGSLILITGFANSMTSSAMEYRSEGIVLGIAANIFKIAGSVIVFGVITAYLVCFISYLMGLSFSL